MDHTAAFSKFKDLCAAHHLLANDLTPAGDDIASGIHDDGTLLYEIPLRTPLQAKTDMTSPADFSEPVS